MPHQAAEQTLLAPLDDVWTFLADPYRLADWWPGIRGIQPDRRGLAPGARWTIQGGDVMSGEPLRPLFGPGMFKRPDAAGTLLITDVVQGVRIAFRLVNEHIAAEIELAPVDSTHTKVTISVDASWPAVRRSYAKEAARRLYDLLQTGAEI
jgi:uncharacterized protein YndB with AHSA1/START domain